MPGNPHDPDLEPIKPYPGSPDDPAAPRHSAPEPAPRRGPIVAPAEPRLWSTTVPLELPVTVDGVLLTEVTIRRLTGDDVAELLLEDPEESTLPQRARARMCGFDPASLWADDSEKVAAACRPLLPGLVAEIEAQLEELESLSQSAG